MNLSIMDGIIIGLLIFMGSILAFEHWHVTHLESQVSGYKSELTQLELNSKKQREDAANAYQAAIQQMGQIQDSISEIMNTKVSSDCNLAMAWMVSRGHDL